MIIVRANITRSTMDSDVIWQTPCYECAFRQFVKSQYPANRSSILVARPAYTRDEYSAMQVIFRTGYGAHHRATLCLKTKFVFSSASVGSVNAYRSSVLPSTITCNNSRSVKEPRDTARA